MRAMVSWPTPGWGWFVVSWAVIGLVVGGGSRTAVTRADEPNGYLIEAESFDDRGGWSLDTQFIRQMGSPYLLAHGLGKPVADATTTVTVTPGTYHVWVRTFDWVARWDASPSPGTFTLAFDGKPLDTTFGTEGKDWAWQSGGTVELDGKTTLTLQDKTGFNGRVDAIYLSTDATPPPAAGEVLGPWRQRKLRLPAEPVTKDDYDLVVVGGGYSGMGAALSAARMGCKVALIQDRPVLGGNGSSEVRVWAMGNIRRGKYPRIGEIVDEFADRATKSPGRAEEFGDAEKEALVRAESRIDLFLNHHVYATEAKDRRVISVTALDTRTSERTRFVGKLFCDATGHGWIAADAGAETMYEDEDRMGMSNMWVWGESADAPDFPKTPWALPLTMRDFPYPRDHHGQWFWESGFNKDALVEAEAIRDWNLRAVYGAFNAMKNGDGAEKHKDAYLAWVAYVGGPRESRRIVGDVILTQDDIVAKREFPDGCVPSTWSIDLHYPKEQYAKKFPDNPFISVAEHDNRVDRTYGYPVPYRCFYAKDFDNLFMAGRCISVTHEALGTVRVMKTCGMMGEVVGKAASLCTLHDVTPREVYQRYWPDMDQMLQLPGKARVPSLGEPPVIPADALPLAGARGPMPGRDPAKTEGTVVDDDQAQLTGSWAVGTGLPGFFGYGYRYAGGSGNTATFTLPTGDGGPHEIEIAWLAHENRGKTVPVEVRIGGASETHAIDMTKEPTGEAGFQSLGRVDLPPGGVVTVMFKTDGAGGNVHIDSVRLRPVSGR